MTLFILLFVVFFVSLGLTIALLSDLQRPLGETRSGRLALRVSAHSQRHQWRLETDVNATGVSFYFCDGRDKRVLYRRVAFNRAKSANPDVPFEDQLAIVRAGCNEALIHINVNHRRVDEVMSARQLTR